MFDLKFSGNNDMISREIHKNIVYLCCIWYVIIVVIKNDYSRYHSIMR